MQTRKQSFNEAVANTVIGFVISLGVQVVVMWIYNIKTTYLIDFQIVVIFTCISIIRNYYIRRGFNWWHTVRSKGDKNDPTVE